MGRSMHRALSPFIALIALAVLLVGVFAIHAEITGHEQHMMVPTISAVAGHAHESPSTSVAAATVTGSATGMAATGSMSSAVGSAAIAVAAPAVASVSNGMLSGMLDCALMAITCVLLLTLVAGMLLFRLPTLAPQLRHTVGRGLAIVRTVPAPALTPSLTLLSISRV